MSNLSWDRMTPDGHDERQNAAWTDTIRARSTRRSRLQMFTRLGLLLMISLAFGLVAELLVRLPPD